MFTNQVQEGTISRIASEKLKEFIYYPLRLTEKNPRESFKDKSNSVSSHLMKAKSYGWLTSAAKSFQMLPIEATMSDLLW